MSYMLLMVTRVVKLDDIYEINYNLKEFFNEYFINKDLLKHKFDF